MRRSSISVAHGVVMATLALVAAHEAACTTLSGADRFAVGDAQGGSGPSSSSSSSSGGGPTVEPCDNGVQDIGEDGIDCGGECLPCAPVCDDGSECATGFCVQGVCCNEACEGGCLSCRAADTIGPDGVCLPARAGLDPKDECANAATEDLCGQTGSCNGDGACELAAAGTVCGPASCLGESEQNDPLACDGAGSCEPTLTSSCLPFVCNELDDTGCLTACTDSLDCFDGNDYCNTGSCIAKKPDGAACTTDVECSNDYCSLILDECSPAQCDNNATDVGETDVDCGGVCGPTCATGETCSVNADCIGNNCQTNVCQ